MKLFRYNIYLHSFKEI